jgi:hypothetical protein
MRMVDQIRFSVGYVVFPPSLMMLPWWELVGVGVDRVGGRSGNESLVQLKALCS